MKVRTGLHFTHSSEPGSPGKAWTEAFRCTAFFLHVCIVCCATVYLCKLSQETCLSSVAASQTDYHPYCACKCMNDVWRRVLRNQHSCSGLLIIITNPSALLLSQESKILMEILSCCRFSSRKMVSPRSFSWQEGLWFVLLVFVVVVVGLGF